MKYKKSVIDGSLNAFYQYGHNQVGQEVKASRFAVQAGYKIGGLRIGAGLDYISGHGTATPYNDEMESKAISWAKLNHVPVNSLKGYWGHTLGAAGIIDS